MRLSKLAVGLASAAMAAGAGGMLAPGASAAGLPVYAGPVHVTSGCTNGVFNGYCGTEQNVGDGLGFSYLGSSDWLAIGYQGSMDVFFDWAPDGFPLNVCITEAPSGTLVVNKCTGASSQLFFAAPAASGFTWQNIGSGLFVTDNGKFRPLTDEPADGAADQEWNFTVGGTSTT